MIKKWVLFLGYLAAIVVIMIYKDPILRWLDDDHATNLIFLIGAAVLLAMIPVVPYGVIAGMLGAKYGPLFGGFLNVLISTIAAVLMFLSVRVILQEQGIRFLAKFKRMDKFTKLMERNAFFAVLTARLLPFVPAIAVNVYAAISRMKVGPFVIATFIGKIPVMFVFALIGDQLLSSLRNALWTSLIYMLFLAVVYLIYWFYRKRAGSKY